MKELAPSSSSLGEAGVSQIAHLENCRMNEPILEGSNGTREAIVRSMEWEHSGILDSNRDNPMKQV